MKHTWKTVILKEFSFCLSKNTCIFHVRQEFHVSDQNSGIKPHILTKLNFPLVEDTRQYEKVFFYNKPRTK